MDEDILGKLDERLGPIHARKRIGIEQTHEDKVSSQGLTFFHLENWYPAPWIIQKCFQGNGSLLAGPPKCRAY
jgi:hypothetical protein